MIPCLALTAIKFGLRFPWSEETAQTCENRPRAKLSSVKFKAGERDT